MKDRISQFDNENRERPDRREPQPIGVILAELLAQYQARFPEVRVTVLKTPVGSGYSPLLCQRETSTSA